MPAVHELIKIFFLLEGAKFWLRTTYNDSIRHTAVIETKDRKVKIEIKY
jgi:hypothetical protein